MQVLVPAAGRGTRLRSRTADQPKALVDVAGKPLLTRLFETLADLDMTIEEYVVVVGHHGEAIVDHYGASVMETPITYVEQPNPLGLAHAVRQAAAHIKGQFMLVNGDNLFDDANLDAVVRAADAPEIDGALLVTDATIDEATTTGVCELGSDGHLQSIVEKPDEPTTTVINTGVAVLPPETIHACQLVQPSARGEYELPDAISLLLSAGYRITTVQLEGWRVNVNTPVDLKAAIERFE